MPPPPWAKCGRCWPPGPRFDPKGLERAFTFLGADFFSTLFMPELARVLQIEAPGVQLRLVDTARGDVARMLQDDAIDMALERPLVLPDWVRAEVLFSSPFVAVAARDHPALIGLAAGQAIPLELYCRLDHALRSADGRMDGAVDLALAALGHRRRVMLGLPQFHAIACAVAEGQYLAALPVQYARAVEGALNLVRYRLPIEVPAPDIFLYWHARHVNDAAHRWMRRRVHALVDSLGFADLEK